MRGFLRDELCLSVTGQARCADESRRREVCRESVDNAD